MNSYGIAIFCFGLMASCAALACEKSAFPVVIDVGHSAKAPGARSARGRWELEFNRELAFKVAERLKTAGFPASALLAEGDSRSLVERAARVNRLHPHLLISIHHDSVQPRYLEEWQFNGQTERYCDRYAGWSLFVSMSNSEAKQSLRFARLLAASLLFRDLPFSKHHAEAIRGENKTLIDSSLGVYQYDRLVILRQTNAPAVLLEAAVIANREEERLASSIERQALVADAIAESVEKFCDGAN
jgi:N-acetylmuramoyl-L-alanine amidase